MDCVYLAAGLGSRMKEVKPKQFLSILGKPVFIYALEVLESLKEIDTIYVMYHKDYLKSYEKFVKDYNISKVRFVLGGDTRQESVFNGLKEVKSDKVIIHEAARPFISKELIKDLMSYGHEDAVVPTIPIPFTVSQGEKYMEKALQRDKLHNVQLPQIFKTSTLLDSHKKAKAENFIATEDGILVFKMGEKVRFVKGSENNIKLTTPLDMIIAEQMIKGIYK